MESSVLSIKKYSKLPPKHQINILCLSGESNDDIIENENEQISDEKDLMAFSDRVQDLYNDLTSKNQTFLAFKLVKILEWPLLTYKIIGDHIQKLTLQLTDSLLSKCLTESKPDLPFVLSFLSGQTNIKKGLLILQNTSSSLKSNDKLILLARLGVRYCTRFDSIMEKNQFVHLLLSAVWARKLGHINGIELASVGHSSDNEHLAILAEYINNTSIGINQDIIQDLVQYAKAFGIMSLTEVMELFVTKMLSSTSPCSSSSKNKLKEMFKAVDKAIEHIPADDDPLNILQSLLDSKISPYDYEVLDYVYKKLNQLIGDQDHEEQQKIHGMFNVYREEEHPKSLSNI